MVDKYVFADPVSFDALESLKEYPEITQKLLSIRDISTKDEAELFLSPDYDEHTHDPRLLKGMDRAVERIMSAIKDDEHIVIFSDYDTDGIPGAVVLHDFFKKVGYKNFSNYIPHRNKEGFGLNMGAIDECKERGAGLIITIDCGIANASEVAKANEYGIDVIITDHHLPHGDIPEAYAIVNPKQDGCEYPFKELCGAAVVFKLVQALIMKGKETGWPAIRSFSEGWEKWMLDMVGVATVSDMVPLVGENRVFAKYGLLVLRKSKRPGLKHLLTITRTSQKHLDEDDIGFTIGPRINAASRMDKPEDAFVLLSTTDDAHAYTQAKYLDGINNERKGVVAGMVRQAKKTLESREIGDVVVIGNTHWKPSLAGLVCNSLVEHFGKPAFVWGREGDHDIKGSCRSEGNTHLVDLMSNLPEGILLEYGGHAFSGGFSVTDEGVHELEKHLNDSYKKVSDKVAENLVRIDHTLALDDVNWSLYDEIEKLSPFGVGNEKPLFLFQEVAPEQVSHFGKEKNHLKLIFETEKGIKIEAIAFFKQQDSFNKALVEGKPVDLVAHIEKSTFGYKPSLRLRIVDIL